MSMHDDGSRDHVDALIDDTARSMTAAPPPVSLREAVRDRIERRRSAWNVPLWQAGLVAASLVAIVVTARIVLDAPKRPASVPAIGESAATSPPAPVPVTEPAVTRADNPQPARRARRQTVVAAATLLPPQPPIVVEPIAVELLEDEPPVELEFMEAPMPLIVEQLIVEPLTLE
jgi:hypothetical protein